MNEKFLEEVKRSIEKIYPNEEVSIEAAGWFSYAFRVGDSIVRVSKENKDHKKEAKVFKFLKGKIKTPVPNIELKKVGDLDYSIHTRIDGNILNISEFNGLSEEGKNLFCYDIANFLVEMHSIPINTVPKEFQNPIVEEYCTLEKLQEVLGDEFSEKQIVRANRWVQDALTFPKDDLVFIHKDLYEKNILVDNKFRLAGIIDFAFAEVNDRSFDFFRLYNKESMDMLNRIISFYEAKMGVKVNMDKIEKLRKRALVTMYVRFKEDEEIQKEIPGDWILMSKYIKRALS